MESVSSVRMIMGIVQDILAAVETASQNKSRCNKVAKRVRRIKDILEAAAQDGTTPTAATRRLLKRLNKALGRALQVVRQCQRSSFLGSVVVGVIFFAGPRTADSLDEVEREIDRCILDLTLANSLGIGRHQQHKQDVAAVASSSNGEKDDDNKGSAESVVLPDTTTTTSTAAIGVPVCTAVVHEHRRHEMVPSYGGYCWSCRSYHSHCYYWQNHGCAAACDCRDSDDSGPSGAAAFYHTQYPRYPPSKFSDDDPNSCSIM